MKKGKEHAYDLWTKTDQYIGARFASGCAMTSKAPDFSGLKDVDGSDAVHINMTKAAVHFAVAMPFIGDASLEGAVRDFTEEAKKEGAERVRIVQSDETTLWWILPPVSFLFTPKVYECRRRSPAGLP